MARLSHEDAFAKLCSRLTDESTPQGSASGHSC